MRAKTEKQLKAMALKKGVEVTFDDGTKFNSERKKDSKLADLMAFQNQPGADDKKRTAPESDVNIADLIKIIQASNEQTAAMFTGLIQQIAAIVSSRSDTDNASNGNQITEWRFKILRDKDYLADEIIAKATYNGGDSIH